LHRSLFLSGQTLRRSSGEQARDLRELSPDPSRAVETTGNPQDSPTKSPCLEGITYGSVTLLQSWFPNVNPKHPRAKTWRTRLARREVVLWACFSMVTTICVTNFVLASLLWFLYDSSVDGVVTLYQGDCTTIGRVDTATHLLINILSTLLMGASNMTLQLIAAPTRKEVDRVHKAGTWLDIGVPSFRNLFRISRISCAIWCCLALSSIPIHFL